MKAITRKLVLDWQEAARKAGKLEDEITSRIDYILRTWFDIFGAKLEYWYFEGAAEGEIGDLGRFLNEDTIYNFYTEVKNYPDDDMIFIDKDGDEYTWQSEIPTRWLYDDNFKEEIIKGKAEYKRLEEERKANKKATALAKKAKDEQLVADAKKKLSKEELAALKRNL